MTLTDLLIQYFAAVFFILVLGVLLMLYVSPGFIVLEIFLLAGNFLGFLFRLKHLEKK